LFSKKPIPAQAGLRHFGSIQKRDHNYSIGAGVGAFIPFFGLALQAI